jgi:lipopolysaccharide transport system ATP-binding protein
MTDIAIRVENLGKQYRIGRIQQRHDMLRDALVDGLRGPIRRLWRTRREMGRDEDTIWALRDVSFEVKYGEAVGIIGRNGAGKSTLLKILSRITEPTEGRATIRGRVGSLLEVGTGFHPELTGRENIYFSGAILGMRKAEIEQKFDEIVAFAEIEKFLDTPVKRYSSGMYVRLAFAVAAHLEPEILLVDEVLAVGDAAFQKKCLGKMGDVAQEGRTVLFVSHNMAAIRSLCGWGLLVHEGQVLLQDSADGIVDRYARLGTQGELAHAVSLDRPDGFSAWVESIAIRCNEFPSAIMKMGDTLTIDVHFRSDEPLYTPHVGLVISSVRSGNVLNANNIYLPSSPLPRPTRSGIARCSLGVLPLMEDQYFVSVWFSADSRSKYHYVQNALRFEVLERDIWGTGKTPTLGLSSIWWPTDFEWRV